MSAGRQGGIAIVVAIAKNGVIGNAGGLPWRLSTDLKRFKTITMGKPVIMGRKTWQSIGRPLPGRFNIVISRDRTFAAPGAKVAHSLDEAVSMARAQEAATKEICVIGGGEIYRQALPQTERLYVTHVEADVPGDVIFPQIHDEIWQLISKESVPAGEKDIYATRYVVYQRKT